MRNIILEKIKKHKCKHNVGMHTEFSKFMIKRFIRVVIILIFSINFIVGGILGAYRFFNERENIRSIYKELDKYLKEENYEEVNKLMEALSYRNIYLKVEDKDTGEIVFDDLTGFLDYRKEQHIRPKRLMIDITKDFELNGKIYDVRMVRSFRDDRWLFGHFITLIVLVSVLGMIFAGKMSKRISVRILQPIRSIIETAEGITAKDLSKRVVITSANDEVGRLGRVINEMMERLEKSFESQKKFVSDASHELRTPIQIVKGYIDLLSKWGLEDKEVRDESIEAIKDEVENMQNLVEKLLFLARVDNRNMSIDKETFIVGELFDKTTKDISLINKNIDIKSSGCDVEISADKELLKQALRAIIDNSIKYSHGNGEIYLKCYEKNDTINLEIKDSGIGIKKEELEKIFDRFYRVDESRTKETGGAGLGLSIVKNIIEMHDGEIDIESVYEQGTTVRLSLPKKS